MTEWAEKGREAMRRQGIPPGAVRLERIVESPGGVHLDYQQVHAGIPVFEAGVKLHFDPKGQLLAVDADLVTDLPPPEALRPAIDGEEAERIAVAHLGGEEVLRGDPSQELGILPLSVGRYVLVWRVTCPAYEPAGDWRFQIDASNGQVLTRENVMLTTAPRGRVFHPNPIVTSGDQQLYRTVAAEDGYGLLEPQTRVVDLQGLESVGVGRTMLKGELVRVVDENPPPAPELIGENLMFEPHTPGFATVMTYFWLDTVLRYLRRLGFADLLSQGVEADPLDGTMPGGAFYSRWSRRMGFAPPEGRRPGMAEDATVILHEFGHAIQDDQVRGWGGHPEAGAMGEGFGDALAAIYFAHVNDGFHAAVVGDWVRPPDGIRRVDRDLHYPEDMGGEVHHDGQIWSRALWDLYRLLGGESADLEEKLQARDTALRLIVQSHYYLGPKATFAEGARALLLADRALNEGRYGSLIRQAVAARGIQPAGEAPGRGRLEEQTAHQALDLNGRYADVARVALRAVRRPPWWL